MKNSIYLLLAAIAVVMAGCGQPEGFTPNNSGKAQAIASKEAVYVSASKSMQLSFKDNVEFPVTVVTIPTGIPVEFSNLHPELMEVTSAGLLKPKEPGTDTLIVKATDGSRLSTQFVVNIIDHQVPATAINVTSEGANINLKYGGRTFDLANCVTVSPADAWEPRLSYESNDTSVATVDANGIVTSGNTPDTATTITITYSNNFNSTTLTRDVNVNVKGDVIVNTDIDRTGWTVYTLTHNDYGFMNDGGTKDAPGTGTPEHLFDGALGSFLSLIKPGGSSGGVAPPVDSEAPSFVVDMKAEKKFNAIKWGHRNGSYTNPVTNITVGGNTYNYLRVYGVYLFGSNDGTTFTPIAPETPAGADNMVVWIPQKATYVGSATSTEDATYYIKVTESTYRHVKVQLKVHGRSYGTNAGQFQHPDYPGGGTTSGQAMQVSEFGVSMQTIE